MEDVKNKLYAPLSVKSRRGRGGTYDYVTSKDVMDRMNEIFGVHWSSEVTHQDIIGDAIIIRVKVTIKDSTTGYEYYQEGFGGAGNSQATEPGNAHKSAYSKALKDACKKWGVGLYLDELDNVYSESNSIPPDYSGMEKGVPSVSHSPSTIPPVVPPTSGSVQAPTVPIDNPAMNARVGNSAPIAPSPGTTNTAPMTGSLPLPPGVSMTMESNTTLTQSMPTTQTGATPNIPPPVNNYSAPPTNAAVPKPEGISDVQKAALHSILKIQGVDYETLAAEAFAINGINKPVIPSPDALTYQEAVYVVKYGNDKFRRRG